MRVRAGCVAGLRWLRISCHTRPKLTRSSTSLRGKITYSPAGIVTELRLDFLLRARRRTTMVDSWAQGPIELKAGFHKAAEKAVRIINQTMGERCRQSLIRRQQRLVAAVGGRFQSIGSFGIVKGTRVNVGAYRCQRVRYRLQTKPAEACHRPREITFGRALNCVQCSTVHDQSVKCQLRPAQRRPDCAMCRPPRRVSAQSWAWAGDGHRAVPQPMAPARSPCNREPGPACPRGRPPEVISRG
jgi:hypothetical protein